MTEKEEKTTWEKIWADQGYTRFTDEEILIAHNQVVDAINLLHTIYLNDDKAYLVIHHLYGVHEWLEHQVSDYDDGFHIVRKIDQSKLHKLWYK
jgi:hypothetical protein